jgi:hypothetical protein
MTLILTRLLELRHLESQFHLGLKFIALARPYATVKNCALPELEALELSTHMLVSSLNVVGA